jgi:aminoglycoside phosphotransferase
MLRDLLSKYSFKQVFTGWSGAEVYHFPDLAAYLKIAPAESLSNLKREAEVLGWLAGKLSVPQVLEFGEADGKHLLLLSEIEGVPASEYAATIRGDNKLTLELVEKAARAMRAMHDLSREGCHLPQDLEVKLATAQENIRRGFVDESDFDNHNQGRTAENIYDELIEKKQGTEDFAFTHGDLCLPNFMILDGEITGFIDLDRGGIADRYQDIALFLRSFALNIEVPIDIRESFCRAYGIESLDEEKLSYYRLLDELF